MRDKIKEKKMTYYAFAKNSKGKIGQILVVRKDGKPFSQEWTGKIYKSVKEAESDMIDLNCRKATI